MQSELDFLIKIAKQLGSLVVITKDADLFKVYVHNVYLKDHYVPLKVSGKGSTVEDAAYDYIRLARGSKLQNIINNKWLDVV